MSCETYQTRMTVALTGELSREEAADLARHLETCAACRGLQQQVSALWRDLARLTPPSPPASVEAGFRARLHHARPDAPPPAVRDTTRARRGTGGLHRIHPAWLAAAAITALLSGYALGRQSLPAGAGRPALASNTAPVSAPAGQEYLLLLRGPAGSGTPVRAQEDAATVAEYRRWAESLQADGTLVSAEKLQDSTGYRLSPNGARAPLSDSAAERIGGFFLIRAHDAAEAEAIARGCPHLRHGGSVELRAIDPT